MTLLHVALLEAILQDCGGPGDVVRAVPKGWRTAVDAHSWPEVLRRFLLYHSALAEGAGKRAATQLGTVQDCSGHNYTGHDYTGHKKQGAIKSAATQLGTVQYRELEVDVKLTLLCCLCDNLLATEPWHNLLDQNQEEQQKLHSEIWKDEVEERREQKAEEEKQKKRRQEIKEKDSKKKRAEDARAVGELKLKLEQQKAAEKALAEEIKGAAADKEKVKELGRAMTIQPMTT